MTEESKPEQAYAPRNNGCKSVIFLRVVTQVLMALYAFIVSLDLAQAQPAPTCNGMFNDPLVQQSVAEQIESLRTSYYTSEGISGMFIAWLGPRWRDKLWKQMSAARKNLTGGDPDLIAAENAFNREIGTANIAKLRACFPKLAALLDERIEVEKKQARTEREPQNRLFRAYARYIYLQLCDQDRKGYAIVYITDAELERARIATKGIETAALSEKGDLDRDTIWKDALRESQHQPVSHGQCRLELGTLLSDSPISTFDPQKP